MTARLLRILGIGFAVALGLLAVSTGNSASAQQAPVGLGTATSFAVLAGTTVTNTGPSTISGDVGVSPGSAIVGFPPGTVTDGVFHAADAVAAQAQADLTTAYNDAAGRTPATSVPADLAGLTLAPGAYTGPTLGLTGTVTLDAQGDPNAVFVFQAASTLITASSSTVALINGADPCNVYWQVGSSATLGTNSTFVGNILALTSITANTAAQVEGRLLARNGAVTLDNNVINRPDCAPPATTTTTTAPGGGTTTTTVPGGGTTTTTAPGGGTTTTTAPGSGTTTTVPGGGGPGGPGGGSTTTIPADDGGPGNGGPGEDGRPGDDGGPGGEDGGPGNGDARSDAGSGRGTLPRTGAQLTITAIAGLLAVGAGLLALVTAKRRRAASRTLH